jgi:hypothetical protein
MEYSRGTSAKGFGSDDFLWQELDQPARKNNIVINKCFNDVK